MVKVPLLPLPILQYLQGERELPDPPVIDP